MGPLAIVIASFLSIVCLARMDRDVLRVVALDLCGKHSRSSSSLAEYQRHCIGLAMPEAVEQHVYTITVFWSFLNSFELSVAQLHGLTSA